VKATDIDRLIREFGPVVRDYVAAAVGDVANRLKALEDRILAVKDGAPGPAGEPGPVGPAGERGLDGPAGADGAPGRDGRDGLPGVQGEKGLDGKDGRDGTNGADGLGFDDIQVEHDGERSFTFTFTKGAQVKTFGAFTIPAVIYREVYDVEREYAKGDAVTWGGQLWIAQDTTKGAKPGQPGADSRAWKLAVKAGRDGKDGKPGPQGPQGAKGEHGDKGRERW
jgi:integrin beta 3